MTNEPQATWARVRAILVAEEYQRRIAAGTIDKGRLADLIGGDVDRMAAEHPGWKQQQIDRTLGEVARPGGVATCPACGLTFNPSDGDMPKGFAPAVPYNDRPERGDDGVLYCRPACARGERGVSLDEWLAANPEAAGPGRFLRAYIIETAEGERLAGLVPPDPTNPPAVAPVPAHARPAPLAAATPGARARAALAAYPHPADTPRPEAPAPASTTTPEPVGVSTRATPDATPEDAGP